jgi:ABC-2 type transport system ATP-binding protein
VARIGEHDRLVVTATGDLAGFAERCGALPGVASATVTGDGVEVLAPAAGAVLAPVVAAAEQAGARIGGVDVREPDLESVFLHLTGRALRD